MNYYAKRPEIGCHNDSLTPLGTQACSVPVPSPSAFGFPPYGDKGTAASLEERMEGPEGIVSQTCHFLKFFPEALPLQIYVRGQN